MRPGLSTVLRFGEARRLISGLEGIQSVYMRALDWELRQQINPSILRTDYPHTRKLRRVRPRHAVCVGACWFGPISHVRKRGVPNCC
ncbi:hypothetical protein BDW67DRAFT_155585 [Aspergillus spinulosporus]